MNVIAEYYAAKELSHAFLYFTAHHLEVQNTKKIALQYIDHQSAFINLKLDSVPRYKV